MTTSTLAATGLRRRYGDLIALDGVDLTARPGEVLAILGPNGAGKTTTLDMLCGASRPDEGEIRWGGEPAAPERLRRLVGLCPQTIQVWPRLTCAEQLGLLARLHGQSGRRAGQRSDELLEQVGLTAKAHTQARHLSGGMQRRLNVALALVADPPVVVLDEPEAGLDPQSRVLIRGLIAELSTSRTIVVTSHDLAEVERVADRVMILDHGQVLAEGRPEALLASADLSRRVEFTTTPADAATLAAELMGRVGRENVVVDAGQVTVTLSPQVPLESSLAAAIGSGVHMIEIDSKDASLEDLFLQLTGRSLRE